MLTYDVVDIILRKNNKVCTKCNKDSRYTVGCNKIVI